MTTLTADALRLCASLDIDTSALPALADETGVSSVVRFWPAEYPSGEFGWCREMAAGERMDARYHKMGGSSLPRVIWDRLAASSRQNKFVKLYRTRGRAYVALVQAIAETPQ